MGQNFRSQPSQCRIVRLFRIQQCANLFQGDGHGVLLQQSTVSWLRSMVAISDWINVGTLRSRPVPHPVMSRDGTKVVLPQGSGLTWLRPRTWPTSCAIVHCDASSVTTAPGRPDGCDAPPLGTSGLADRP